MNFGNIVIMMSKFGSKSGDFASGGDFAQRDFGDLVIMMSKFGSKSGDFAQRGK